MRVRLVVVNMIAPLPFRSGGIGVPFVELFLNLTIRTIFFRSRPRAIMPNRVGFASVRNPVFTP